MHTDKELQKHVDDLKMQLDAVHQPDFRLRIKANLASKKSPKHFAIKLLIAASLLVSINSSVMWYAWNITSEVNQTEILDSVYDNDSSLDTFLSYTE